MVVDLGSTNHRQIIFSNQKTKQNEKANNNRNTNSKWWWCETQLIASDHHFSNQKTFQKMKKLTATETQTVNGGGFRMN